MNSLVCTSCNIFWKIKKPQKKFFCSFSEASFEGGWGAVAPYPKEKEKRKKEEKKRKRKKDSKEKKKEGNYE